MTQVIFPKSSPKASDDLMELISPANPAIILGGIVRFGLAPDGSDLRDLMSSIDSLRTQLAAAEADKCAWMHETDLAKAKIDTAEAQQATARKALEKAATVLQGCYGLIEGDYRFDIFAAKNACLAAVRSFNPDGGGE